MKALIDHIFGSSNLRFSIARLTFCVVLSLATCTANAIIPLSWNQEGVSCESEQVEIEVEAKVVRLRRSASRRVGAVAGHRQQDSPTTGESPEADAFVSIRPTSPLTSLNVNGFGGPLRT